ncbi:uncharacterized protein ARMOST_11878 [Armillaria ostoyae]|uniref:SET domain-containing protein n=1 Tax=Armillaria ostoyae TaxID=47428 RepID=A0A284RID6_ARMOS|nr:uncharacterized protein ARMOST_11878 [Armillaria ostoyae]
MAHRFLKAAKANWRFFSTLKSPAKVTNLELDRQLEELTSAINAVTSMTPEEIQKKMVDMFRLTNDDMKALAPLPDENDPGHFEHEPRPDDDVRTHVQVGGSQCLLTNYLKRQLEHIPGFPRPVKEMGDKAYRISPMLHRGLGICSPNIRRKFHMSSFSMQLRTARDIEEGEEIFTTYMQDLRPAADRAKGLVPYGIKCTCRACLDPAKSDPIRAAVLNYSPPILLTSGGGARDAAVEILARIEEEGLQASDAYYETLDQLFNAYAYAQDEENALMYGEKLWLANLAAGEPLYEMFRNAEVMKKTPQWMTGEFEELPERLVSLFNAS